MCPHPVDGRKRRETAIRPVLFCHTASKIAFWPTPRSLAWTAFPREVLEWGPWVLYLTSISFPFAKDERCGIAVITGFDPNVRPTGLPHPREQARMELSIGQQPSNSLAYTNK